MSEILSADVVKALVEHIGAVGYSYTAGEYPDAELKLLAHDAALRASNAALLERIALDNAVCLCGCAAKDHEDLGEDGEQCEHEDHECLRVAPAVLAAMQRLRASNAAMREALDAIDARLARRTTLDGLTRLQKIELALRVCEETDPKGEVAAKYVVRALARAAAASPSASDGGGGEHG